MRTHIRPSPPKYLRHDKLNFTLTQPASFAIQSPFAFTFTPWIRRTPVHAIPINGNSCTAQRDRKIRPWLQTLPCQRRGTIAPQLAQRRHTVRLPDPNRHRTFSSAIVHHPCVHNIYGDVRDTHGPESIRQERHVSRSHPKYKNSGDSGSATGKSAACAGVLIDFPCQQ